MLLSLGATQDTKASVFAILLRQGYEGQDGGQDDGQDDGQDGGQAPTQRRISRRGHREYLKYEIRISKS